MTKEDLLAIVSGEADAQEAFYMNHAPGKHDQEEYEGVQVVDMNVDILREWLNDDAEAYDALSPQDQREVWEASDFHFGIMGYDEADAEHYWAERGAPTPTFVWTTSDTTHIIKAKNTDEAYRKAIASRLESAGYKRPTKRAVIEVTRWFNEHDAIREIDSVLRISPYSGDLPTDEEVAE